MSKQRVTFNVYYTRADCVEAVIDEEDFAAYTASLGDPHELSITGAYYVMKYIEDRGLKVEVGEGELTDDGGADFEVLGEEEEEDG